MVYTPSALGLATALRANASSAAQARQRGDAGADTRVCNVAHLRNDGSIAEVRHTIPVHPIFDAAFSAFARGTLISTTDGPVAIEDLTPGMKVATNECGPSPVLWIGSMAMRQCENMPNPSSGTARLTRIMTGALGMGRPLTDVMTGPGARIAQRSATQPGGAHSDQVLRPVHDMIDGTHVIALSPPGTVHLYHLALRRHATITAAGLAFETYHPGPGFENNLNYQHLWQFIEMFPHIMRPADFGSLAHPRAPLARDGRAVS
ncbi:Hint domain-containing protein [Roseovarius sp. Pro17]|uniref:Hint domain-containing protein n=1 Tax=Roseovarius sp. Pro17 TaxID=3108175 RepID=UPI002D76812E|nr:Hint domain-containing protein [Roseovarius sp. Pro17]